MGNPTLQPCDLGSKAMGSCSITVSRRKQGSDHCCLTDLVFLLFARHALTELIAPGFFVLPVHRPCVSHKIVKRASEIKTNDAKKKKKKNRKKRETLIFTVICLSLSLSCLLYT